jgi:hypothetical protein
MRGGLCRAGKTKGDQMIRKSIRIAALMVLCLGVTLAFAHHGPDKIVIDDAVAKQPAVPFDHGKHAQTLVKSCDTCHHTSKGLKTDEGTKVPSCASCHLEPKGAVGSIREASLTKNPYHQLCIGCHKGEKKGPTLCKDCHKK